MTNFCELCGDDVDPKQVLNSMEETGKVVCKMCMDQHDDMTKEVELEPVVQVTALEPIHSDIVRPAIDAQGALAVWKEFQDLKKLILEQSDIQVIQGKNFVKKSGWRKFATFYNLTDRIVEETRIQNDDRSFIWKIKVECKAPNGRVSEGVAMCSSAEKSGTRIEHDVYATAHTRAKNRAISDMVAAGEVSAEEMA